MTTMPISHTLLLLLMQSLLPFPRHKPVEKQQARGRSIAPESF